MEYQSWTIDQLRDELERLVDAEIQAAGTLRTLNENLAEVRTELRSRGYRV